MEEGAGGIFQAMETIAMIHSMRQEAISFRISVTDRCQLRCAFCIPLEGVKKIDHSQILSFEQIITFVRFLKAHFGLTKVHITGGEPLLRKGIADLIAMLVNEKISDLALTTNGQLLSDMIKDLDQAGLQRINISLVSLNKDTFRQLTGGGELSRTLAGIESALNNGLKPVKLNTIVLKNANDHEVINIARFGLEMGCEVRFLELMPIGPAAGCFNKLFVSSKDVHACLKTAFDLVGLSVLPGSSSRRFRVNDSEGRQGNIGLISSCTVPFCHECRRLRLTACGRLLGCLALGRGPDLRPWLQQDRLQDEQSLVDVVNETLCLKRNSRSFTTTKDMASVGG